MRTDWLLEAASARRQSEQVAGITSMREERLPPKRYVLLCHRCRTTFQTENQGARYCSRRCWILRCEAPSTQLTLL